MKSGVHAITMATGYGNRTQYIYKKEVILLTAILLMRRKGYKIINFNQKRLLLSMY